MTRAVSLDEAVLRKECRQISRYLLNVEPATEIIDRYVTACRKLWATEQEPELLWWQKHPRMLPLLDAATGLLRPQSLLRKKILLVAALLETTPAHSEFFLRPPPRMPWILMTLAGQVTLAAAKTLLGIPVLWWARRVA